MGILSIFSSAINPIAEVAKEWIDTDKESAEAKSLFVKTLDPNGIMRQQLSRFASVAYGFYLINATILLYMTAFKIGDVEGAKLAAEMVVDLFTPITASWGAIVTASFGVNGINSFKGN